MGVSAIVRNLNKGSEQKKTAAETQERGIKSREGRRIVGQVPMTD